MTTLTVEDFGGVTQISSESQLEVVDRRFGAANANELWITRGDERFPAIAVLVRGELACAHYFPDEQHAGVASIGDRNRAGTVTFLVNTPAEMIEVAAAMVVPFSLVREAIKLFLRSAGLPNCIEWQEL